MSRKSSRTRSQGVDLRLEWSNVAPSPTAQCQGVPQFPRCVFVFANPPVEMMRRGGLPLPRSLAKLRFAKDASISFSGQRNEIVVKGDKAQ
jgi:hypothetical protein